MSNKKRNNRNRGNANRGANASGPQSTNGPTTGTQQSQTPTAAPQAKKTNTIFQRIRANFGLISGMGISWYLTNKWVGEPGVSNFHGISTTAFFVLSSMLTAKMVDNFLTGEDGKTSVFNGINPLLPLGAAAVLALAIGSGTEDGWDKVTNYVRNTPILSRSSDQNKAGDNGTATGSATPSRQYIEGIPHNTVCTVQNAGSGNNVVEMYCGEEMVPTRMTLANGTKLRLTYQDVGGGKISPVVQTYRTDKKLCKGHVSQRQAINLCAGLQ